MKKIIDLFKKEFYKTLFKKAEKIIGTFSLFEKIILIILTTTLIVSTIGILININNKFLVDMPEKGGELVEGLIGVPKFINPIIATSNTDKDLAYLIYSGLVKIDNENNIINDLAEKYEISENGLEYKFFIRKDAKFHDKKPVTTDDIIFTILKIQDPVLKSKKRQYWENIIIEKINDHELILKLKEPNKDFIYNADIGILPKHIWQDISSEDFSLSKFNTEPIGSGPYKLDKIYRNKNEIPESYTLKSFKYYVLGEPYISKIIFRFAKNEDELQKLLDSGLINSIAGLSPELAKRNNENNNLLTIPLSRMFAIFLNPTENTNLNDKNVRKALEIATPREIIVKDLMHGFAEEIDSAIPKNLYTLDTLNKVGSTTEMISENKIDQAIKILEADKWKRNDDGFFSKEEKVLSVSISVIDVPDLINIAEEIKKSWQNAGIKTEIKIFNSSDLNQNILRPRNFESLLFALDIHKPVELYSFWHSSSREDPGLNITNYANITVDKILEQIKNNTSEDLNSDLLKIESEIKKDIPAIFIYSPKFIYLLPKDIENVKIEKMENTSDRFFNIHQWFIETNKVWRIFIK